ncbi:MAG: (2Fe-2S)-binding protein [Moorella humiferrea]|uniref:BFD-like [2Fe-2S] binding domain protein n=1 Tax=Neomoorella humiferrea TaxID=676965 RepID=A0A2T0AXI2_9FIRM|nr:(2Fe-2S)-binding protein [Moorella humiferrea]MBE3573288.1 (2Fe-2S)-binding protein [Moorella humiferrea]PRR75518.1 BFD-like [2Fe-2S] binding domain protein [Moorella humiferrea]
MAHGVCGGKGREAATVCPRCGERGQKVAPITIASLLNTEAAESLEDVQYNLCLSSACNVVYYGDNGTIFTKEHVRVPVWFKEETPRIICYCNNVTDREILEHIVNRQCCHNLQDIREHTGANGGRECLIKNPAGT